MTIFNKGSIDFQSTSYINPLTQISHKPAASMEPSKLQIIGAVALGIIAVVGCVMLTRTEIFAASRVVKAITAVIAMTTAAIAALFSATLFKSSKATSATPQPPVAPVITQPKPIDLSAITKIAAQPLPLPPVDGIKMQLINFDHGYSNTCWLNSAVIFMATQNMYDDCLNSWQPLRKEASDLRNALKVVINDLRSATSVSLVDPTHYAHLIQSFQAYLRSTPHRENHDLANRAGTEQLAADDFITPVLTALNYAPRFHADGRSISAVQKISTFVSPTGQVKDNLLVTEGNLLKVEVDNSEIGLAAPFNIFAFPPQHITVRGNDGVNGPFVKNNYLLNAPEVMDVYFPRICSQGQGIQNPIKCMRDLDMQPDGTIQVIEYAQFIDPNTNRPAVRPNRRITYAIEAAITHRGDAKQGHWVAYQRTVQGVTLHDDRSLDFFGGIKGPQGCGTDLSGIRQASYVRLRQINAAPA